MRRAAALLVLVAAVAAACGDGESGGPPPAVGCKDATDGEVVLVADDVRWDTDCLRSEPGPLTIVVDNRDDGVNHNVHLPDAEGSPATDLERGPSRQELDVDLPAGTYELVCDLHPNMVATLTVR
jgi:plastocyanin